MYGLQTLCYTNPDERGQRQIVVEGDIRQAVKVYQAGDWITEAYAKHLGIYEWLLQDPDAGPQARAASDDPEAQSRQAEAVGEKVKAGIASRQPFRATGREALAFVENAAGQPIEVSAAERAEAGRLGGQMTGPTIPEVAEAGSVEAATDQATAEMTSGQTPPSQTPARTPPRRSEPPSGSGATPSTESPSSGTSRPEGR